MLATTRLLGGRRDPLCLLAVVGVLGCGGEGADGSGAGAGGGGVSGFGGGIVDPVPCELAVLDRIVYSNGRGTFVGVDAVDALAADCVLGDAPSLVSSGCSNEVRRLMSDNTLVTRAELSACIHSCIGSQSDEVLALTGVCLQCWGTWRSCEVAFCADPCATGVGCEACLCEANCFEEFLVCSGLPAGPACEI